MCVCVCVLRDISGDKSEDCMFVKPYFKPLIWFAIDYSMMICHLQFLFICFRNCCFVLTLLLLNTTCPVLANSVDPDQLASSKKPTDLDLHCLSLNM